MKIHLNHFTYFLTISILLILTIRLEATNYYVDAGSGNDGNSGTDLGNAWATITKAGSTATAAGDSVYVIAGDYSTERTTLTHSGSSGGLITFKAVGNVLCRGFNIQASYIKIDGFTITNTATPSGSKWTTQSRQNCSGIHLHGNYIQIENNTITEAQVCGISFLEGSRYDTSPNHCIIKNNKVSYGGFVGIYVIGQNNLIQGNDVSHPWDPQGIGDADAVRFFGNDIIFRDNYIHDLLISAAPSAHMDAFQTYENAQNIYFIKNVVDHPSDGMQGIIVQEQNGSTISNIVTHNNVFMMHSNGSYGPAITFGAPGSTTGCSGLRSVNDTYTRQYGSSQGQYAFWLGGTVTSDDIVIKNNIFYQYGNGSKPYIYQDNNTNTTIDYNDIYVTGTPPIGGPIGAHEVWMENPLFTNYQNADYTLQSNSPCIDAGTWLTTITSSTGSGTSFVVDDATYFQDGMDIAAAGDTIQLEGKSTTLIITDINYNTNTITVNQSTSWTQGDGVAFPYNGSLPDIGAYEKTNGVAGNNPPSQPSSPSPANGAINQPTSLSLSWSCSDPDGDPLTYDVYFGETNNPPLMSGSQPGTSYNTGQLSNNTTYYWKIVAKDNQGASTAGPLWSFSTEATGSAGDNTPPELVGVQSVQSDQVVLDFSEPLDSNSALNSGNYLISDQIEVQQTALSQSHTRVTLTTNQQVVNHIYTVEISNVTDTAGNAISAQGNSAFYKFLEIGSPGYIEHLITQVSASATTDTNTSPAKTLDGLVNGDPDPNSRWAAEIMPQWIQYDLGAIEPISLIAVSFYQWNAGRIYQYSIQTSNNEAQWNEVISNASSSSQEWTFNEFTDLSARYVRIICMGNNQADWAGVWETRIFEPDAPTAVNFSTFTARLSDVDHVTLNWTTSTEQNCKEFNVTRKGDGDNNFLSLGTVPGHGSVSDPHHYTFTDSTVKTGHYSYRLEEIDFSGNINYSSIVEIETNKPENFRLGQNYPNPFNPTTTITYTIPERSSVRISVYNTIGQEIALPVDETKDPGTYKQEFNAAALPSGVYFYRIQAIPIGSKTGKFAETRKMILLK